MNLHTTALQLSTVLTNISNSIKPPKPETLSEKAAHFNKMYGPDAQRFMLGYPSTCQWEEVPERVQQMLIEDDHVRPCRHHENEYLPWFGQCQWCEFALDVL